MNCLDTQSQELTCYHLNDIESHKDKYDTARKNKAVTNVQRTVLLPSIFLSPIQEKKFIFSLAIVSNHINGIKEYNTTWMMIPINIEITMCLSHARFCFMNLVKKININWLFDQPYHSLNDQYFRKKIIQNHLLLYCYFIIYLQI